MCKLTKTIQNLMAVEIERKFLVDTTKWKPVDQGIRITQSYLSVFPSPTVRIRIAGEKAWLTIKGPSKTLARPEFEYEVPVSDADELLNLAVSGQVEKVRHEQYFEGFLWEIDVFSGKNTGLVLAEIELESENQVFSLPHWILDEVTGDGRYYNSYLSHHPFQEWSNEMA
jgi:CYTH domain-containing protein